jgi:hypothetical protein
MVTIEVRILPFYKLSELQPQHESKVLLRIVLCNGSVANRFTNFFSTDLTSKLPLNIYLRA